MTETALRPIIEFPLRGEWEIPKSPMHDRFAFDFVAVVNGRTQTKSFWGHLLGKMSVEDVYSWSQSVYVPVDGVIVAARDGWPDRTRLNLVVDMFHIFLSGSKIDAADLRPATGNYVMIEADPFVILLAHLRQGSIRVSDGQTVRAGPIIAEVGNSGRSLAPHLHFQVMDGSNPLTATIIPFKVRSYERWTGTSWEVVQNGMLEKKERIRYVKTVA